MKYTLYRIVGVGTTLLVMYELGYTSTTRMAMDIGTMELLRLGAGTAVPELVNNVMEDTGDGADYTHCGCQ